MAQYLEGIVTLICIYIVAVCGLTVLTGFTGLFSLGHAGFMSIGAYTAAIMTKNLGVPFIPALLLAGTAASICSLIVGYPTLRGKLTGDYFAIAMFGFAEAIRLSLSNIYGVFNGALGIQQIPKYSSLFSSLIIAIVVICMVRLFTRSQHGKILMSIKEEEQAAELIGVNVTNQKIKALMISAFFCGVSGAMLAFYYTFITPNTFSTTVSNDILAAVVLGGMGSVTGPIIASAVLTALPEVLRFVAKWRLVIYGLLIVLVMLFRSEGLFGHKELSFYPYIKNLKEKMKTKKIGIK